MTGFAYFVHINIDERANLVTIVHSLQNYKLIRHEQTSSGRQVRLRRDEEVAIGSNGL
jgi:hypothetical protein